MKIKFENVNFGSDSGPNSFGKKLHKYLRLNKVDFVDRDYDAVLCFIEDHSNHPQNNLFQRLDGIYFNKQFDYKLQNFNIEKTYNKATGVIFQSEFNKKLTEKYFGQHKNSTIIHNGADLNLIKEIKILENNIIDKYDNVWSCAASWRPHKRLKDNVRYFMEHRGPNDCLVIAGSPDYHVNDPNIFYAGQVSCEKLISLYKRSKYFLHLAWLDHCPNVVVDARAAGCKIICSSAGGTREIAGKNAVVIEEAEWDFEPVKLYEPPEINFTKKIKNNYESCYDMNEVSKKYLQFMLVNK